MKPATRWKCFIINTTIFLITATWATCRLSAFEQMNYRDALINELKSSQLLEGLNKSILEKTLSYYDGGSVGIIVEIGQTRFFLLLPTKSHVGVTENSIWISSFESFTARIDISHDPELSTLLKSMLQTTKKPSSRDAQGIHSRILDRLNTIVNKSLNNKNEN